MSESQAAGDGAADPFLAPVLGATKPPVVDRGKQGVNVYQPRQLTSVEDADTLLVRPIIRWLLFLNPSLSDSALLTKAADYIVSANFRPFRGRDGNQVKALALEVAHGFLRSLNLRGPTTTMDGNTFLPFTGNASADSGCGGKSARDKVLSTLRLLRTQVCGGLRTFLNRMKKEEEWSFHNAITSFALSYHDIRRSSGPGPGTQAGAVTGPSAGLGQHSATAGPAAADSASTEAVDDGSAVQVAEDAPATGHECPDHLGGAKTLWISNEFIDLRGQWTSTDFAPGDRRSNNTGVVRGDFVPYIAREYLERRVESLPIEQGQLDQLAFLFLHGLKIGKFAAHPSLAVFLRRCGKPDVRGVKLAADILSARTKVLTVNAADVPQAVLFQFGDDEDEDEEEEREQYDDLDSDEEERGTTDSVLAVATASVTRSATVVANGSAALPVLASAPTVQVVRGSGRGLRKRTHPGPSRSRPDGGSAASSAGSQAKRRRVQPRH